MSNIIWLNYNQVVTINKLVIEKDGGMNGVRNIQLLLSALDRPKNVNHYNQENDLYVLSKIYAEAICSNHAFYDGNKRTAFMAMDLFLYENGIELKKESGNEYVDLVLSYTKKGKY